MAIGRRGRPRPVETIKRDAMILRYLRDNGATSRNDLANALGLTTQQTYLALSRLDKSGKVRRTLADGENVWEATSQGDGS